jgi:hypothetical protein
MKRRDDNGNVAVGHQKRVKFSERAEATAAAQVSDDADDDVGDDDELEYGAFCMANEAHVLAALSVINSYACLRQEKAECDQGGLYRV